ncbi:hypothetical protein JOB18_021080 [Solea senegalensis]|uniref:Uncharacterized protein n=1 Tax=Solea senegalensis TaxID=28829 RepID=A0AAV6PJX8_SOLSE|nr:hypothetical protein JOB18_021080 [Solea senegalensis]
MDSHRHSTVKLQHVHRTPFSVEDILDPTKFTRRTLSEEDAAANDSSIRRDELREKQLPPAGECCSPEEEALPSPEAKKTALRCSATRVRCSSSPRRCSCCRIAFITCSDASSWRVILD